MCRWLPLTGLLVAMLGSHARAADAFDRYTNPILKRVPAAAGVQVLKQATADILGAHDRTVPGISGTLLVVQTNDGRFSKLVVQAAQQKLARDTVPILLIDRYVTYREGQERAVHASGTNVVLFGGFHLNLDIGQIVPAGLGADVRFVVEGDKSYVEPLGSAKLYLVTKPLPEAAPPKSAKLVIGETFEPRYFNGTYKLQDDGRRSGTLTLHVADNGEITGSYYSDRDGQKYEVNGKLGSTRHAIQFTIRFPRTVQEFHGWLFTGNGKALAGYSRMQEREAGFYALRTED
jgi:hypothetical protein